MFRKPHNERRNSVLHFDRVLAVKATGIDRDKPAGCAVAAGDQLRAGRARLPASIDLIFAGGGAVRLEVEVIEARLADLGGAWEATSRPDHKV